ncbi:cadherin-like beta sandwich domain-containing protein [Anoxynatronum buryatiense]|uniref:cadherin-like beta sandwich domain-containing protein n=1 Tax=Anoxynatronum buryatiense TaxID=489973 RepID=UPI0024B6719B|nr:cadherin-like beta sandwich domain-containing protein [Anoxynatronum buryatiense]
MEIDRNKAGYVFYANTGITNHQTYTIPAGTTHTRFRVSAETADGRSIWREQTGGMQIMPNTPIVEIQTPQSITLSDLGAGIEYHRSGGNWQESRTFTGLTPETSYTFTARRKVDGDYAASPSTPAVTGVTTPATYAITVADVAGGTATVTTDKATAAAGETVTITIANIEAGKQVASVNVTGAVGEATMGTPGVYTFLMPTEAVTVIVTLEAPPNLSGLTLSSGTLDPVFHNDTAAYTASVGNAVTSITVTPSTAQGSATVTVDGIAVSSGTASADISLPVGATTINVVVTAEDGTTTKTYTIQVTRAASANANLSGLTLSSGTLDPVFHSDTTAYTASVGNAVTSITVTPSTAHGSATVTVDGIAVSSGTASADISLPVGATTINVVVTAEDGTTTKTYTIQVTRAASANANLSGLTLSSGTLDPVFHSDTAAYTASVGNAVTSITVTPSTAHGSATVTVDGIAVSSGTASADISLPVGATTINVVVTAEDGTTTKTYTVEVLRREQTNVTTSPTSVTGHVAFTQTFTISLEHETVTGAVYASDLGVSDAFTGLTISALQQTPTTITATLSGRLDQEGIGKITIHEDRLSASTVPLTAEVMVNLLIVSYDANVATGGNVPVSRTYPIGASITVSENTGNLEKAGHRFAGWNTQANGQGTSYSAGDSFTMPNNHETLYAVWAPVPPAPDNGGNTGGGSGGGSGRRPSDTPTAPPAQPAALPAGAAITVLVNGEKHIAGAETSTEEKTQLVATLKMDTEKIISLLNQIQAPGEINRGARNNVVEVLATTQNATQFTTILTADLLQKMAQLDIDFSIVTEKLTYQMPAKAFNLAAMADALSVDSDSLHDMEIELHITYVGEETIQRMNKKAQLQGYEVLFPPVAFNVVATSSVTGEKKEVSITQFASFVSRTIELPAGLNPEKVTTGVIYHPDGSFSHIPTTVFEKEGKCYARLSSFTNSTYSVIHNAIMVPSVKDHWSKAHVEDLAARLIIAHPETFAPDDLITRGEFAAYITKALGLYRPGMGEVGAFIDAHHSHELLDAITIATQHGIISGYPDGSFRPSAFISRQEAMVMYAKAMNMVGLRGEGASRITTYTDQEDIADWAYEYVNQTTRAGVFSGRTPHTIDPLGTFTYAEAATAIRNLLIKADLID